MRARYLNLIENADLNSLFKAAFVELIRLRASFRQLDEAATRIGGKTLVISSPVLTVRLLFIYFMAAISSILLGCFLFDISVFDCSWFMISLSFARLVVSIPSWQRKRWPRFGCCLLTRGESGGLMLFDRSRTFCPRGKVMPLLSLYKS